MNLYKLREKSLLGTLLVFCLCSLFVLLSCKKYLDKRPLKSLYIPTTLEDLQALLDNNYAINYGRSPSLLEVAADNYYALASSWQASTESDRLNYIWHTDAVDIEGWTSTYQGPIYYSNIVLDALPNIDVNNGGESLYNSVKGSALFNRAFAFYQLAQVYCRPYSPTANTDLGIILRQDADVEAPITRTTVQETYDLIVGDLKAAADLLPITTAYAGRPNKTAAYGALARVYLSMRDYVNAGYYADLSLQQNSALMNYNTDLGPYVSYGYPFYEVKNPEISYIHTAFSASILFQGYAIVDSILYQSYDDKDLRKSVFYILLPDGQWHFNGSYDGYFRASVFDGITTAEMYLVRAEAYARSGDVAAAMSDLNILMINRWKDDGSWVPFTATDAADALRQVLEERRKELAFRGLRWSDLRRFNEEGANITLKRILDVEYTLPPNDLRWVMLIPWSETTLAGIEQNPR